MQHVGHRVVGIDAKFAHQPRGLVSHRVGRVTVDDSERAPEQTEDGQVRNRAAVRETGAIEIEDVIGERPTELEDEP